MGRMSRALKAFTMRFGRQAGYMNFMPASTGQYAAKVNAWESSVVVAPIMWAMRTFPEAPIMVQEHLADGTEEEKVGHPLTALLHRPNPFWSGELMWWATIGSLLTNGNGYWIKVRDGQLRISELWWVPSSLMRPRWTEEGTEFITHYTYSPNGIDIRIEVEDVVHLRYGIDPDNPRLGMSPVASVLREVFSDDEAARFTADLLRNMGVPGLIIAPDGDAVVGDDDLEAAKDKITRQFTGRNRGKPFIAGAPTKVMQFGFSPEQMVLKDLRRIPEERVSAVLGIPAIVAGLGAGLDRSTFANMSEAREMAYESTIIPLQRLLAADIANQMLDDYEPQPDRFCVGFDLSTVRVLQEDENAKTERKLKELNAGAITLAEYRRETNREADKTHDVYLRPFNVVEVPVGGSGAEPVSSSSPVGTRSAARPELKATRMQQDLIKRFRAHEATLAGPFAAELVDMFIELGESCATAMNHSEMRGLYADTKDAADDDALVRRIMDLAAVDQFNDQKLRPAFEAHYTRVIADTLAAVNDVANLNVNLPDEVARAIVRDGGTRAGLIDVSNATRNAIFRSLAEARELGEGPVAAARRIRDQVPAGRFTNAGPQYRSQLIARTETKYAQNVSAMESYKQSPAVTGLLAFDAQGGSSDDDCISRDGVTFTFAEASTELAREHPNGTLSFAPMI